MKLSSICLLGVSLSLASCNANGARAQADFNAAGDSLGNGHVGTGAKDIGRGFSDGANATGDAIVHAAHQVGNAFSQ